MKTELLNYIRNVELNKADKNNIISALEYVISELKETRPVDKIWIAKLENIIKKIDRGL